MISTRRVRTSRIRLVAFALTAAAVASTSTSVLAEAVTDWSPEPIPEIVEAYVFACQPVESDIAGVRQPLDEAAAKVYAELFVTKYDGSCRDFYYLEVVPQLDGEFQPFIIPVIR